MTNRSFVITLLALIVLTACGNANGNTKKTATQNNANQSTNSAINNQPNQDKNQDQNIYQGANQELAQQLSANLHKSGIQAKIENITPTAMPDIYMVNLTGMPPIFTDKTGTYLIQGEIVQIGNARPINISNQLQAQVAKSELAGVDKNEMIIFPATGTHKASIYVFSDPTCHYCQVLHQEIQEINALGIEVRYLAWPRGEQIIPLTQAIWCHDNPKQALTDAKLGKIPAPATCNDPVAKHMALGIKLDVSGTPAIFTESGKQIGGYLPAKELAESAINAK